MKCGLLGQKLGHSYSPQIHSKLADYDYSLFEKEPDELAAFLQSGEFSGLNVTIPYKKMVIPYLSELSPIAAKLGAVNTIVRREDGNLIGHNTDYFGFRTMVESSGLKVNGKKVLVLGSGGASNTAAAVLEELGSTVQTWIDAKTNSVQDDETGLRASASLRYEEVKRILQEILAEAMEKQNHIREQLVTIDLIYDRGQWWALSNTDLMDMLSGSFSD